MDPATLTLVAMLTAGAFGCLAALYISIPYPPPVESADPQVTATATPMVTYEANPGVRKAA